MASLPTRTATVALIERFASDNPSGCAVLSGPGGVGKSAAVDEILERRQAAGLGSILVSPRTDPDATATGGADETDMLIIEDGHLLSAAGIAAVLLIAEQRPSRRGGLLVATRPTVGPEHARLREVALEAGTLVILGPLSEDEAALLCRAFSDAAPSSGLIERLLEATHGHPLLAVRALQHWLDAGSLANGQLADDADSCPPAVVDITSARLAQVPDDDRVVLIAAALLDDDPGALEELVIRYPEASHRLASTGLLIGLERYDLAPMAAAAVIDAAQLPDTAAASGLVADILRTVGADAELVANTIWRSRATGEHAVAAYIAAGEQLLSVDRAQAMAWFDRAAMTDANASDARAGRALCHLLDGSVGEALADATDVLRRDEHHLRATAVMAGSYAIRDLWNETATVAAGVENSGGEAWRFVAPASVAIAGGRATTPPSEGVSLDPAGDALGAAVSLLIDTLTDDRDLLGGIPARLRQLALLSEALVPEPDLPLTVDELSATVALVIGELHLARSILGEGPDLTVRASQVARLRAWADVRLGRDRPTAHADDDTAPKDASIVGLATEAAIARRSGDVAAGAHLTRQLAEVTARRDPDLLSLDAAAELLVLTKRFKVPNVTEELGERVERLLEEMGRPPAWVGRVAWCHLEAAATVRDDAEVERIATELAALANLVPGLLPLAKAAQLWPNVLRGEPDTGAIQATVAELRDAGFVWEAARLAGQAAIRLDDAAAAKSLLGEARSLRATQRGDEPGTSATTTTPAGLSEREVEVARLVLNGLTYKHIGETLFISAKTVEHHVAHVRRKLGLTGGSRAEFLAALREDIGDA